MIDTAILTRLNAPTASERLAALADVLLSTDFPPADPRMVNNHIHTTYSFSPYSPTAAVYAARAEGLCTAGIVDHDSIAGALEFVQAGLLVGIPTTVGIEARVSMAGTPFESRRTNNPDQIGCSYMALHGVPHARIPEVQRFFEPLRARRNVRNRAMVARINGLLAADGISLDFDRDVLPLSLFADGGTVTERHLMYALARALVARFGRGAPLVERLAALGVALTDAQRRQLTDTTYAFYDFDVLNVLKAAFVPKIYLPATDECPTLLELATFADHVGAILCYAYLGDVKASVTGDKAPQPFEDAHLDELFDVLAENGIRAVTYMPTRNSPEQLDRMRALCRRYGMFEVSGEDINSPRQSFRIGVLADERFSNLIDATWALIAHENGTKPLFR